MTLFDVRRQLKRIRLSLLKEQTCDVRQGVSAGVSASAAECIQSVTRLDGRRVGLALLLLFLYQSPCIEYFIGRSKVATVKIEG